MQPKVINDRYRVVRELGQGGMGRVYLVEDLHREKERVALKTVIAESNQKNLERFCVEFTGLANLRHPNIAAAHDFGRVAGTNEYFFTSEYVEGVDLYKGTTNASLNQLLDVITQTLRGLGFIHTHGFLHNDLKPSNILIETPAEADQRPARRDLVGISEAAEADLGRVKIIDFGLFSTEHTCWTDLFGTPHFLSPERIRGLPTDRRSDLYSLGFILYLLCARAYPFNTRDSDEILGMHLDAEVPGLAQRRPDLPPALIELVERLMKKRPEDRFQSAEATLQFLETNLAGNRDSRTRPQPPALVSGNLFERESELIYLEECFCTASALASESPCIVLKGPAGIGKTRLVRELSGLVQVSSGAFIELSCRHESRGLHPAAEAILSSLETSGVGGLEPLRKALSHEEAGEGSEGELSILLGSAVLKHAKDMPLLILFDDFQGASETVRRFALNLAQSAKERLKAGVSKPKLLVVIASRKDDTREDQCLDAFPTIRLKPFSGDASRAFLKHVFAQDDIPEEILNTLAACAHGNPGQILELAGDLVQEESIWHSGSKWMFPV